MLVEFGIPAGELDVAINTLGEPEERVAYREALRAYFTQHREALDEDSKRRLETNPLRILDSKNPEVLAVCAGAPVLLDTLGEALAGPLRARCGRCWRRWAASRRSIPRLVRGLDYYTGTIFEIRSSAGNLGSQNTLAGGGRYDRLVQSLGGPATPALGFGMGLERVLLALSGEDESFEPRLALFVASMGEAARRWALPVAHRLRLRGIRVEIEHRDAGLKAPAQARRQAAGAPGPDRRRQRARQRQAGAEGPRPAASSTR